MSVFILLKVYGDVQPANELMYAKLNFLCTSYGLEDALTFENTNSASGLSVHYEGIFFPIDEFIAALVEFLEPESHGKIDYLDIEHWTMVRFIIQGMQIHSKTVPLNHVLASSGH